MAVNMSGVVTCASQAFKKRYKETTGIRISQLLDVVDPVHELEVSFIKSICGKQESFILKGLKNRIIGEWVESGAGFVLLAIPELLTTEDLQNYCLSDFPDGDLQVDIMSLKDEASASMREATLAAKSLKERNKELENSKEHLVVEIRERQKVEEELSRLNQIYDFLSQSNQALVRAHTREELFEQICRVAIERGKFLLAWIGMVDLRTHKVVPVAWAGGPEECIPGGNTFTNEELGKCDPVGTSIREGRHVICNDFGTDPRTLHWRQIAEKAGIRAVAAFPIRFGVLVVYAHERDFFCDKEVAVLDEVVMDISFGLARMEDKSHRQKAEAALRKSEAQYRSLVETTGTGFVIIDTEGRVADANAEYIRITGHHDLSEIRGRSVVEWTADYEREKNAKAVEKCAKDGCIRNLELDYVDSHGHVTPVEINATVVMMERRPQILTICRDITQRKQIEENLRESEAKFRALFETSRDAIMMLGCDGFFDCNKATLDLFGCSSRDQFIAKHPSELSPSMQPDGRDSMNAAQERIEAAFREGGQFFEWVHKRVDGTPFPAEVLLSRMEFQGKPVLQAVVRDITDRKRTEVERQQMSVQLLHAQKMESIGQLAAGIAHEINTPIQFVGDNTKFLKDSFADLQMLMAKFREMQSAVADGRCTPELTEEVQKAVESADLDYLTAEIPKAIDQSLEGVQRVAKIVRAMKEFSHPDEGIEKVLTDINKAIETTTTVARNEWKYVADMKTELSPSLPPVPCLPGDINQVFLNLIVNAAHAIADRKNPDNAKGAITISTRLDDKHVEIRISDTGIGVSEKNRSKIFEPFFTTKGVGRGTGQGLAIAHNVVVKKHFGTITFETKEGLGTTFIVRLPISGSAS